MTIEIEEKTDLDISAELLQNVPDTYQKNAGYIIWDLMMALGKVLITLYNKLRYLVGFIADIETLDYEDLVKFVYQRGGIIAKTATCSTGQISVVSGSGTIVEGNIFETADGLQFVATETKEVSQNDTFNAQCLTSGASGNVPVGTITVIPEQVPAINGISAVSNLTAFTDGYDDETKESIIERYYFRLQMPITSANKNHYVKWATDVTGVGQAICKPLWNGENTVKVIICDSNKEPASSALVESVQEYIDPYELVEGVKVGWGCGNGQAPIGAYCTVESATAKTINISANISKKNNVTFEDVTNNIKDKIKNYIKSTVFSDPYVSYARIGACILDAEGVIDYSGLLVNGDTNNITITETSTSAEIATLGTVTLTEVQNA